MTRRLTLTPTEQRVYGMLVHAADYGLPCPKNMEITAALDRTSPSAGSELIKQIADKGHIKLTRGQCRRVITIVKTGKSTAGEIPAPHWRDRPDDYTATEKAKPWRAEREAGERRALMAQAEKERIERMVDELYVNRDPCLSCGVRRDIHDQHGCSRWRAL